MSRKKGQRVYLTMTQMEQINSEKLLGLYEDALYKSLEKVTTLGATELNRFEKVIIKRMETGYAKS